MLNDTNKQNFGINSNAKVFIIFSKSKKIVFKNDGLKFLWELQHIFRHETLKFTK